MNDAYLNRIESWLKKLKPMEPQATDAVPRYRRDHSIEAVIFDIYGTLIISASGDVMRAAFNPASFKQVLDATGITVKVPEADLVALQTIFQEVVKEGKSMARAGGIPFPELEIVDVWRKTLTRAEKQGLIEGVAAADLRLFTFIFELSSNQIWPMPGMQDTVSALRHKGYPLGIVSNAQFYTPVIMNYLLNGTVKADEFLDGFERDLSVFSYKLLKGKPDTAIYEALLAPLRKRGLEPKQVLFVGNDMLKDMYAAQLVGFKTCFIAGDKSAYRLRTDHPQASKTRPDYLITDLRQLLDIL